MNSKREENVEVSQEYVGIIYGILFGIKNSGLIRDISPNDGKWK